MDLIDSTPILTEPVIDANGEVVNPDNTFAKEVTKTLVISIATTAGTIGGMLVAGFAYEKFHQFRTRRAAKKTTIGETIEGEVDDLRDTVADKIKS